LTDQINGSPEQTEEPTQENFIAAPEMDGQPQTVENETPTDQNTVSVSKNIDYLGPIAVIVIVLALDQWLKYWVKTNMFLGEERTLMGSWARLHFVENNGIAFGGHLPGALGKFVLTSFRILAAAGIFWYLLRLIKRNISRGLIYSGALVFAGATGNIIDSIFYGVWFKNINNYDGGFFFGQVVDMLYFPILRGHFPSWVPMVAGHPYEFFRPVFNLADSSITCGILLIILFFRKKLKDL
jgi:signal peptidase II